MAIVNIGSIFVDMGVRTVNPFPSVSLQSGFGYIFILETVPVGQSVEFAYFVPCPFVVLGGLGYEIGCRFKWYPKGVRYTVIVPVYEAGSALLDVVMGLIPIEIFPGRADPPVVQVACSYEDTLAQPIAFGL